MNTRGKQRGESVIGILVALVISVFSAIAMLTTYRTMVEISIPATRTAKREGQAATALITAQTELQQAGFGILDSETTPTLYLDPTENNRKVVWSFRETLGGSIRCAGLLIRASTPPVDGDGIYFLAPADCSAANDASVTFQSRLLATASVLFEPSAAEETRSYDLSQAVFVLAPGSNCGPYGVPGSRMSSQLLQLKDLGRDAVVFSHCLSNPLRVAP